MIRIAAALLGLALSTSAARAEWYEATTSHFVVYANDDAKHLSDYAAKLEKFDKALRLLHGIPDRAGTPNDRVAVYVLRNSSDIEDLSGPGVRGFYHSGVEGAVAFVSRNTDGDGRWGLDADSVLRHEYSHHFMFNNYDNGALPLWYVEGFAEFHATAITQADGAILFGQSPGYRAYSLLMAEDALSAKEMLVADTKRLDLKQVSVLYGKGWALFHLLTFEPSHRGQLARYIGAINAGKTPLQAAETFGNLGELDRELGRYIRRSKMNAITIDAQKLGIPDPRLRKLTEGEAATMAIRIQSKAGVTKQSAPGVLTKALKAAERFPNDPPAQLVVSEAAYDADDFTRALAAADRAIAADPKNEKAYVYRGKAMMGQAQFAKATDQAAWDRVRTAFSVANRLDNDDPEPLAYFYRTFVASGAMPTANARAALRTALDLAPEDAKVRFELAVDLLANKQTAEARETLKTLAYSPHGGADAKRASDLIAAIDSNDAAAIEKLSHPDDTKKTK